MNEGSPTPPVRLRMANQQALAWGAFTIVGAIAIAFTNEHPEIRSFALLIMMAAYALMGVRAKNERNDLPDSVYFMGFIWSVIGE